MSVKLVRETVAKFLQRPDPEVLCLRGRWGVGKTFAWSTELGIAAQKNAVALKYYSYVSLFGVNSLDELKFAIFENVTPLVGGVVKADLKTLDSFVSSKLGSWRKLARVTQSVPIVRNVIGGDATALVAFTSIRNQLICIDDLERRGSKLDVSDVLGLISYLREQRGCKVALILNDEKLDENAKQSFGANLEKVVDISLVYAPSPAEAAKIAIEKEDDTSALVREKCKALGITNIRVIRRALRVVIELRPLLAEFEEDVFGIAATSTVLFCWSHDQPEEAPPLSFLESKKPDLLGLREKEGMSPAEVAWNALLESYGYTWTDEFDVALMHGIRDGYFDPEAIKPKAETLNAKVLATKADGSFETAWRLYHDSFGDNEEEVLDGLFASFMKNIKYISPTNLNGTVTLFKDLGRSDQAKEMLKAYMDQRDEGRAFFDLDEDPFGSMKDPDVRAAFQERFDSLEEKRDISDILLKLKDHWGDEVVATLASLPVEEYRKVFKSTSGPDLRKMLAGVFQFDRIVNATDQMREISSRAREALKLIGSETRINRRRVGRFGVKFEEPPAA